MTALSDIICVETIPMANEDGSLRPLFMIEADAIRLAMKYSPTLTSAASALGMSRSTFYRKLSLPAPKEPSQ